MRGTAGAARCRLRSFRAAVPVTADQALGGVFVAAVARCLGADETVLRRIRDAARPDTRI
jgi:hypothetical protein